MFTVPPNCDNRQSIMADGRSWTLVSGDEQGSRDFGCFGRVLYCPCLDFRHRKPAAVQVLI